MLPFERVMAEIVAKNKMKIDVPGQLYGEQLNEYHKFYEESMYTQDFSKAASKYITAVNKNDRLFGYGNYLDYRLRSQKQARSNAISNRHEGLADYITKDIARLEETKSSVESQMILGEDNLNMEWAKRFRDGAINAEKWKIKNNYSN